MAAQTAPPPAALTPDQFMAESAAAAPPPAAEKSFWDDLEAKLPGTADTGLKGAVHHIQDTRNWLKSTYDVSAPGIAQQIYKKLSGQPDDLKKLPAEMVTQFALAGEPFEGAAEGASEGAAAGATAKPAPQAAVAGAEEAGNTIDSVLSRATQVAKRRISENFAVKGLKDLDYIVRGDGGPATPSAPTPKVPNVPDVWGKGRYGTPVDQWGQRIPQAPQPAAPTSAPTPATPAPIAPAAAEPTPSGAGIPRTLSGDSALRQVLTGQDTPNLLKIARSRGINVTQEAQLKPSIAGPRLVNKIVDDFSDDELDDLRDQYLENTRMGKHNFGDIGSEAWKTMSMKTYFPDVKIPAAQEIRTAAAIRNAANAAKPVETAPATDLAQTLKKTAKASAKAAPKAPATETLEDPLAEMLKQVKAGKKLSDLSAQ